MNYSPGQYRNSNGRLQWGVFSAQSRTWSFAMRTGRKAAEKWAAELNREIPCHPTPDYTVE